MWPKGGLRKPRTMEPAKRLQRLKKVEQVHGEASSSAQLPTPVS